MGDSASAFNQGFEIDRESAIKLIQKIFHDLGSNFTDANKIELVLKSFPTLMVQLRYNIQRFQTTLIEFGYTEAAAEITSRDICLKPLLYSMIPRILSSNNPEGVLAMLPGEDETAFRDRLYASMLPEMTVYLFDETKDRFANIDFSQPNMVVDMINRAEATLLADPNFYMYELSNARDEFLRDVNPEGSQNVLYRLLHPFFVLLQKKRITNFSVVLQLISDVLTNENRAQLIYETKSATEIKEYSDMLARLGISPRKDIVSRSQAQAYSIMTNQGLLLVTYTSLLFNDSVVSDTFEEHLTRGREIEDLLLQASALVRITDDLGDMKADSQNNVINIFLADDDTKDAFISYSRIRDASFSHFVHTGELVLDNPTLSTQQKMITVLLKIYQQLVESKSQTWNAELINAIKAVIFAAFINAAFNDRDAAQFTGILASSD